MMVPDLTTKVRPKSIAAPPYLSLQWYFNQGETPTSSIWPTQ